MGEALLAAFGMTPEVWIIGKYPTTFMVQNKAFAQTFWVQSKSFVQSLLFKHVGCKARLLSNILGAFKAILLFKHFGCKARLLNFKI